MTVSEMVELEEVQALLTRGQELGFLGIDEVAEVRRGRRPSTRARPRSSTSHLDEVGVELLEEARGRVTRRPQLAEAADRPPAQAATSRPTPAPTPSSSS